MTFMHFNRMTRELTPRTEEADNYHPFKGDIQYKDRLWQRLNSRVNLVANGNTRWVSLGSSSKREILYFDSNSPIMNYLKSFAAKTCQGKSPREALKIVNAIINHLTAQPGKPRAAIQKEVTQRVLRLIQAKRAEGPGKPIELTMDELIKAKSLICRHTGLMAASILAHLVEQRILPPGKVRQYRSIIKQDNQSKSPHTWATYREQGTGRLWVCDPFWDVVKEANSQFDSLVARGYGNVTLNNMLKRLNSADGIHPWNIANLPGPGEGPLPDPRMNRVLKRR